MLFLPSLTKFLLEIFTRWTWKKGFFTLISVLSLALFSYYGLYGQLQDSKNENKSLRSEKEQLLKESAALRMRFDALGVTTDTSLPVTRSPSDFSRDWDTRSFYLNGEGAYCPRATGGNNYQRMVYLHDTPLAGSELTMKVQLLDENLQKTAYKQRVVVGISLLGNPIAEYDIPTRFEEGINFRVLTSGKGLISGGKGTFLSSPIKAGSKIEIGYKTQPKLDQLITHLLKINSISAIEKYGVEPKSVVNDSTVEDDPTPNTLRGNLFIGSYVGGCIKVIDWSAS